VKRCVVGLKPGGLLGVKENNCREEQRIVIDEDDSSVTRCAPPSPPPPPLPALRNHVAHGDTAIPHFH
jgi:hypothetical protein